MSILDNYYGEGMSIREKIEDLERKVKSQLSLLTTTRNTLSKFVEENKKLKEEKEIRALNDRDNLIQIEKLEQENKKLKSREEKLLAYYKWYVDKEHNLTEVEDIITENINLKEKVDQMQENYNNLNDAYSEILDEKTVLEEQLDNKEKLNKSYREEIDKLKIDLKLYENAYGHMFE